MGHPVIQRKEVSSETCCCATVYRAPCESPTTFNNTRAVSQVYDL